MLALTQSAQSVVRRLIEDAKDTATGLRVMVEEGGCAGLQYRLGLDTEPQRGDQVYEFDGVRVFVDPFSLPIVDGLQLDFVEELGQSGFVFDNPSVGDQCSCGKSFGS